MSLSNQVFLSESLRKSRAGWDEYFMNIATVVASRSTCDRKFVGAVIVRDKTILSTGYNGSIRKLEHCSEVGHMMENDHCVATIHAECNAILQAAKNGVCIDGATIYTTASPCWPCFKMIANAGIKKVCYGEFYRDERIFNIAKKINIELVRLNEDKEENLLLRAFNFLKWKQNSSKEKVECALEMLGLVKGINFEQQANDFIVHLPQNKTLLVEAKTFSKDDNIHTVLTRILKLVSSELPNDKEFSRFRDIKSDEPSDLSRLKF